MKRHYEFEMINSVVVDFIDEQPSVSASGYNIINLSRFDVQSISNESV